MDDFFDYPTLEDIEPTRSPIVGALQDDETLASDILIARAPKSGKRAVKSHLTKTGKAYIVRDKKNWYSLPIEVRRAAKASIDKVFRFGGLQVMRVYAINEGQVPSKLDFVDAVVRLYANNSSASWSLRYHAHNQVNQLSKRVPQLKSILMKLKATKYKIDAGRSFTLKESYKVGNQKRLICISESVIALREAFAHWALWTKQPQNIKLSSIGKAKKKLQQIFGIALGKLIAHEIRHQLAQSSNGDGLVHAADGLGANSAPYWNPKIEFSSDDKRWILSFMSDLVKLQGSKSTESVSRN